MTQYLEQRVVEEVIEVARRARRIGKFTRTTEQITENDYLSRKMGNIPLVGALVYTRNNVLKIECGIIGYEGETPQLAGVYIQNIDPEARLDDEPIRRRMYEGVGTIIYEIPKIALDMAIEEVRQFHDGVERGFLYKRGRADISHPVFEKVLLAPRTMEEIAHAIMDVDHAGEEWIRSRGGLESEMNGSYRQAIEIRDRS